MLLSSLSLDRPPVNCGSNLEHTQRYSERVYHVVWKHSEKTLSQHLKKLASSLDPNMEPALVLQITDNK